MMVDMIGDIVDEIKDKFNIDKVYVDYDFRPASREAVLELLCVVLEDSDVDSAASGETWVSISDDGHAEIVLLKRGVTLQFKLPRSSNQKVKT